MYKRTFSLTVADVEAQPVQGVDQVAPILHRVAHGALDLTVSKAGILQGGVEVLSRR